MTAGGGVFRIGAMVLAARRLGPGESRMRPFGTALGPCGRQRRPREPGDRTQTPPVVGMEPIAREANRCSSRHRNGAVREAVPSTGGQRLGVALRFSSVRFATKDVLDVVVIVVFIAVLAVIATADDVAMFGRSARTGRRRTGEADQKQRGNDAEQSDERGQQYRLRHRGREGLAQELGQGQGAGGWVPAARPPDRYWR